MPHTFTDSGLSALLGQWPLSGLAVSGVYHLGLYASAVPTTASSQIPSRTAFNAGAGFTEVTGDGYARRPISAANWGVPNVNANGVRVSAAQQAWTATGNWAPAVGFFLAPYPADNGSDVVMYYSNFDSLTIRTLVSGDILQLTPTVQFNVSAGS
jgi:hypothetical protein